MGCRVIRSVSVLLLMFVLAGCGGRVIEVRSEATQPITLPANAPKAFSGTILIDQSIEREDTYMLLISGTNWIDEPVSARMKLKARHTVQAYMTAQLVRMFSSPKIKVMAESDNISEFLDEGGEFIHIGIPNYSPDRSLSYTSDAWGIIEQYTYKITQAIRYSAYRDGELVDRGIFEGTVERQQGYEDIFRNFGESIMDAYREALEKLANHIVSEQA